MAKNKNKKNKFVSSLNICPFCKTRKTGDERYCFACNLNFSELENTTVKETLKHKKSGKFLKSYEGEIVYSPLLPNDVSYSTLKMLVFFLGIFGVHNFYAGRIWRGIVLFVFGVATMGTYIAYSMLAQKNISSTAVISAMIYCSFISIAFWFYDIFGIIKKKYKFPVVLKTPVDVEKIYSADAKAGNK